ncbi:hypothetical protein C8F04DRAFT_1395979 [Mycena alexandri]|uniref:Uncharacterized protein n=1 Tax=Mycena alexandri TaxID=1745969 RepID=A0AAD6SXI6_9AGAR|nr:hypothetical protein C8F04DRAFT_1395979 [Mycena alexandri]
MPHPCFDMKNMKKIPARLKSLADGILDGVSGKTIVQNFFTISDRLPPKDQAHFLPVFYETLEGPPFSVKSRDSLSQKEVRELRSFGILGCTVLKSLDSLRSHSLFPQSALADIWNRMWTCITVQAEFIDTFEDPVEEIWFLHLSLIMKFAFWEELAEPSPLRPSLPLLEPLVGDTPCIREYLTTIWARMIHDKVVRDRCATPMRYILCYFMRTKEEENFQDIVLGAGGTVFDVCSLLLKHLDTVLADIGSGSGDPKWIIQSLVFVLETIVMNDAEVIEVLAPQRLVKKLVNLSFAIHTAEFQGASPAGALFGQLQVFFIIVLVFRVRNPQAYIREGLRSGLLVSMAQCTDKLMSPTHPLYEPFVSILAKIVPGYLTSYSVLIRLERALELFEESGLDDRFSDSELEGIWTPFHELALERIALRAEYDESHRSVKICDSLSVRVDKDGTDATTREKSFLRFLLQADCITHKHTILALHGESIASTPEQGPFYTAFNYAAGAVYLSVLPAKELSPLLPAGAQRLGGAYQLRRHGAAQGTLSLNVAILPRGRREFRYWILPMRSSNSRLSDELARLVGEKSAGAITGDEYDRSLGLANTRLDDVTFLPRHRYVKLAGPRSQGLKASSLDSATVLKPPSRMFDDPLVIAAPSLATSRHQGALTLPPTTPQRRGTVCITCADKGIVSAARWEGAFKENSRWRTFCSLFFILPRILRTHVFLVPVSLIFPNIYPGCVY